MITSGGSRNGRRQTGNRIGSTRRAPATPVLAVRGPVSADATAPSLVVTQLQSLWSAPNRPREGVTAPRLRGASPLSASSQVQGETGSRANLDCRGRPAHGGGDAAGAGWSSAWWRTSWPRGPTRPGWCGRPPTTRWSLTSCSPVTTGSRCAVAAGGGVWVPIIMVTARAAVEDRVRGLDAGADDYLTAVLPRRVARPAAGPGPARPERAAGGAGGGSLRLSRRPGR